MAAASSNSSQRQVTSKEFQAFNSAAAGIRGVIDTLGIKLQILEADIRADEEGKMENERTLLNLKIRRQELKQRIDYCEAYLGKYDSDLGPFQKTYEDNTKSIGTLYGNARKSHKKGIQSLVENFDYHPAFKRPGDSFTATPFDPKRLD
jgi:hypothetical protein